MNRRKTPEQILDSIARLQRGRLKIIVGAASGSGKTFHLLLEGKQLMEQGVDVVVGSIAALSKPQLQQQLEGLEIVPGIRWPNEELECDMDVDALLHRNAEVVLVDGLAHRNRPGAVQRTRFEEVEALLQQGISIMTTLNAYELEGVAEAAFHRTGVRPEVTVPLGTLELADEVRLIDVSPETILKRLEEGGTGSQPPAISAGGLNVLRELALRLVAEGVAEELAKHREQLGLAPSAGTAERIAVCAQYDWNGSIYIRRGQQIARRLNGDLAVLAFVYPRKPLRKEQLAFKRSIIKLTEKVGAAFEEMPVRSKRSIPAALLRYAAAHHISRIVMGHSKEPRIKQLLKGDLAGSLLSRAPDMDLFLMADRAEQEGERILPAKQHKPVQEVFRRTTPEVMAERLSRVNRGSLKVYIGAAPGVGKTYTMLREGNGMLRKGEEVVIGLLETHGRQETEAQIGALETIPRKVHIYRGIELSEMDTDAILARSPELVLVDELAHTNVPGSRFRKRYEDVIRLLDNGISVVATMNVQHLESLNDSVERLTGVRVRETVPDFLLELADEVELIDVSPQMLRQRLKEGKVYAKDKIEQALSAFFTTTNLIGLRELALRELADEVDERLEAWDRSSSLRGPLRRREVIVVGVSLHPGGDKLIRRGFRIAHRLKAEWHVVHIEDHNLRSEEARIRAKSMASLTHRLGGIYKTVAASPAVPLAGQLVRVADQVQATQLIVGRSAAGRGKFPPWKRNVAQDLLRLARHMDVLIASAWTTDVPGSRCGDK
ncbi:histidine kinase [Paenibacillus protaetiae]|uniref:Histidine kinase n=1 Tax=Paenibacillus protaetiae TaxID=2509456 RepID=A0A4P6ETX2_9BACL|nr:histidine kinase [Paenibacillus protaetiae]QAY66660.1 histidine kinase [Paenibacillus protaetiae]